MTRKSNAISVSEKKMLRKEVYFKIFINEFGKRKLLDI
jgi:hypothetical protein